MKRLFFMAVALFTVSAAYSEELRLIAPNGGENWVRGRVQTITWRAQGVQGNVRLILLKGAERIGVIANNIPASAGSFAWTVGSYYTGPTTQEQAAIGTGYKIRVKALEGTAEDASDRPFTIADPHPSGSAVVRKTITVAAPNGGETWKSGETKTIRWSASEVTEPYCVALVKGGTEVGLIADNVPAAQKTLSWHIGDPLVGGQAYGQGNDYKVQVRAKSGDPKDESNRPFTLSFVQAVQPAGKVMGAPTVSSIKVLSPNGGESYFSGDRLTVRYQTGGSIDRVTLNLVQKTPSVSSRNICANSPNNGQYVFEIPNVIGAGREAGTFVIEAHGHVSEDTWVKDESDRTFTIQRGLDLELLLRDLDISVRRRGTNIWEVMASLMPGYTTVAIQEAGEIVSIQVKVKLAIKNTGFEWPRAPLTTNWRVKIINVNTHADFMSKEGAVSLVTTDTAVEDTAELVMDGSVRGTFRIEIEADPDNLLQEAEFFRRNNKIARTFVLR
jgi:hypothetical protein